MKYKLSDICIGGGSYGIAASAVDYSVTLPTYLRITDINDDGTLDFSGLKSVDAPNSEKYYLAPNDIVFARTGASTGRNYFYDGNDGEFVYAGFLIKFSIDPQKVNPKFIKYYCQSKDYYDWIASFNTGSTRGNINARTFGNMPIPDVSRKQQDVLVDTLSALDDKIANNTKINHHLEQMAQAIFKSWFVDFEPFANNEFFESELGKIPAGWKALRIEAIAEKVAMGPFGSNIKVETFVDSGIPIISGNHLRGLYLDELGYNYITKEHACRLSNSLVHAGDIVFTHAGNIGQVALIPDDCEHPYYVISQRQFYLRCDKSKAVPEYINYFFHSREGQGKLLANTSQTGVPSIARPSSHLKAIVVPVPPIEVQREWLAVVQPMLRMLNSNRQENKKLSILRDSLLPRLMSGELSVAEMDVK